MVFATRNDITYITALHGIVAIFVHQIVSSFHVTFVVAERTGSFMVHHQFDAFVVGILVEHFDVEIRVRSYEIEHIVLVIANPVFPTDIPTFNEQLVKTVFRSKVDIAFHVFIVGAVSVVRLCTLIVDAVEVHCVEICI